MKDSDDFMYKYEMDVLPNTQDLDLSGTNDWLPRGNLGVSSGELSYNTSGGGYAWITTGEMTTSPYKADIWTNNITNSEGWTVEFRAKVTQTGTDPHFSALGFGILDVGGGDEQFRFALMPTSVYLKGTGDVMTGIDTTQWHTYRIACEPGATTLSLWVDNELVSSTLGAGGNTWTKDNLRFGEFSSNMYGTGTIDYVRIQPGAFAPVPEPSTVVMLAAGLLCLGVCGRRRRRDCRW